MPKVKDIQVLENIGGWGFNLQTLLRQLKGWQGDEIRIRINSYGGEVTEGLAIYNTLLGRDEEVTMGVVGYAMSMGSVLLMAADRREMPENGYLMIHNPWTFTIGDVNDHTKESGLLEMLTRDLANIYSKRTGIPIEEIRAMMDEEKWMNGEEALELGFVDALTQGVKFEASFDPKIYQKLKNVPTDLITDKPLIMDFKDVKTKLAAISDSITNFLDTVDEAPENLHEEEIEEEIEEQEEEQIEEEVEAETKTETTEEVIEENEEEPAMAMASIMANFSTIASQLEDINEVLGALRDEVEGQGTRISSAEKHIVNLKGRKKPAGQKNTVPGEGASASERAFNERVKRPANVKTPE